MEWEETDITQLPQLGHYEIRETDNAPEEVTITIIPFKLFDKYCFKVKETGNIWVLNFKTWEFQLLVEGYKK